MLHRRLAYFQRFLIIALLLSPLLSPAARAATINVTANAADVIGVNGSCSLREAISAVNGGADANDCVNTGAAYGTGDTINLPAGTYTNAIAATDDEELNANGDLDIRKSVSIVGAAAATTVIDGGGIERVFDLPWTGGAITVSFSKLTIQNGDDRGTNFVRRMGAALYNTGSNVTMTDCHIKNNTNNSGGRAAIFSSGGSAVINRCLFTGNTTTNGGSALSSDGTAILTVSNSTFTGNADNSGSVWGGTIYTSGTINLRNNTFKLNTGPAGGATDLNFNNATVTMTNNLLANGIGGVICKVAGAIATNTNNLIQDNTCSPALFANPGITTLANNGGETQTFAIGVGSPALDAGDNATCTATDQRGVSRPQDGDGNGTATCDIGAYELGTVSSNSSLSVTVTGYGSVTSVPAGIYCVGTGGATTCSATFSSNQSVSLVVSQNGAAVFDGWGGDCAGTWRGADCVLDMGANRTVTATFSERAGRADLSPSSLTFTPDSAQQQTVTLTNNSAWRQTVDSVTTGAPFNVVGDDCSGRILNAADSCTFDVTFDASDKVSHTGTATIMMNNEPVAAATVSLTGTANNAPNAPTLVSPENNVVLLPGTTVTVDGKPVFVIKIVWTTGVDIWINREAEQTLRVDGGALTDQEGDTITYRLNICGDAAMTSGCQVYNVARNDDGAPATLFASLALLAAFGFIRRVRGGVGALLLCVALVAGCGSGSSSSDADSENTMSQEVNLASGVYYWNVTATDSNGAASVSETRKFTIE